MKLIQLLLIIAITLSFLLYLMRYRSTFLDRIIGIILYGVVVLLTLLPDKATAIANLVGVGRGADLIFYFFIVCSIFINIVLFSKISQQQASITLLARNLAIAQAKVRSK